MRRRAAWSDLRKGVLMVGFGLALSIYSLLERPRAQRARARAAVRRSRLRGALVVRAAAPRSRRPRTAGRGTRTGRRHLAGKPAADLMVAWSAPERPPRAINLSDGGAASPMQSSSPVSSFAMIAMPFRSSCAAINPRCARRCGGSRPAITRSPTTSRRRPSCSRFATWDRSARRRSSRPGSTGSRRTPTSPTRASGRKSCSATATPTSRTTKAATQPDEDVRRTRSRPGRHAIHGHGSRHGRAVGGRARRDRPVLP